jgi:hypothetical protein
VVDKSEGQAFGLNTIAQNDRIACLLCWPHHLIRSDNLPIRQDDTLATLQLPEERSGGHPKGFSLHDIKFSRKHLSLNDVAKVGVLASNGDAMNRHFVEGHGLHSWADLFVKCDRELGSKCKVRGGIPK